MFIQFLFSPINLLFLLNAFFFIYVAPFYWRSFVQLQLVAEFLTNNKINNNNASMLLVFLPLLLIPVIFIYFFSLSKINANFFFPIEGSFFIKFNLLFVMIAAVILLIAKKINYKSTQTLPNVILNASLYVILLYFIFLILIAATTVICLNAFPDGKIMINGVMNYKIIFAVYFAHLLCMSLIILLNAEQRIFLFFLYFLGQSYLNYTLFNHFITTIKPHKMNAGTLFD